MASQNLPKLVLVTVAAGTGTTIAELGGDVIAFAVKPPTAQSTYDIEFLDSDAFGLGGEPGLTGNNTVYQDFQAHDQTTINIRNASVDGTYRVKVWFRES